MKHAIRHIHFVGVGGVGMSGIAEILLNLGYRISGSDLADSATLKRLATLGITTYVGHDAAHIAGADAVVTSTAVQSGNPEVIAAREKKILEKLREKRRKEFIARLEKIEAAELDDLATTRQAWVEKK